MNTYKVDDNNTNPKKNSLFKELLVSSFSFIKSLKDQSILVTVEKNYTFIMFLTFVGLVYIFNSLYAERQATKVDILEKQIKELKSEYMTINAKLSRSRKQSEVTIVADTIGLKLLKEPPFKLIVKAN